MSAKESDESQAGQSQSDEATAVADEAPEAERLNLDVKIESPSACERHVTVTVSREDVDRYLDEAYSELMATAAVPGFRVGRAPRKLVESRFKDEIGEKIKGSLLMDSLSQISEDQSFTAISEPELKLDAIEVPDDGPMVFEFDIEVRPEFDLPQWRGLKIERPMRDFTDADIDQQLEQMLARYGQLVPYDGAAEDGDYVTANIRVTHNGAPVAQEEDRVLRLRPTLSFLDGRLENFSKLLAGAAAGDTRTGQVALTQDAPNEELRGKKLDVEFQVLDVKKLKLPELTEDFLQEMGSFESEEKMREAIRANLQRQLQYEQQKKARQQITAELLKKADWDLPPGLLKRQSVRELERAVMELRRAGFSEAEIRARQNELRQNSAGATAKALKEHFILERIAEEEKIEAEEGDFESEIFLIAMQSGESPRRVRAQIEKRGLMDVLQNQIVERKVLEAVQAEAKFVDLPYEPGKVDVEAISMAAGGDAGAIPAAQAAVEAEDEA
ncbi:MAG TPA: trigger factor [Lacipirellulaceae bacterium]|nr:trigger factor [Lacipirellulaceae bacterium]